MIKVKKESEVDRILIPCGFDIKNREQNYEIGSYYKGIITCEYASECRSKRCTIKKYWKSK